MVTSAKRARTFLFMYLYPVVPASTSAQARLTSIDKSLKGSSIAIDGDVIAVAALVLAKTSTPNGAHASATADEGVIASPVAFNVTVDPGGSHSTNSVAQMSSSNLLSDAAISLAFHEPFVTVHSVIVAFSGAAVVVAATAVVLATVVMIVTVIGSRLSLSRQTSSQRSLLMHTYSFP